MAYNPYEAASNILNLKGQWETADEENRNRIAEQAKQYYNSLINNNYGNLANQLQNSNYSQAQGVVGDFKGSGKSGKTAGRKYMTDVLTGKYGMTQAEANKAITWDADSGDVFVGGINVGKGDSLIDGTNYWNDASVLDNALSQYIKNTGKTLVPEIRYDQGKNSFTDKFDSFYDAIGQNPFESAQGKSILDYYGQLGEQAGYNQIAAGAGANSGNVDSYSQANAIRQNAALRSQGEQAAISAYNNQMNNYYGALGLLQGDNQQTFDNGETAKNSQMNRYGQEAAITGLVPNALSYNNNMYFANGELANPDIDFQAVINAQNEILKTSTDPTERAVAQKTIQDATQARAYKILTIPGYEQYANTMQTVPAQQTAAVQSDNALRANERYITDSQASTERYTSDNALAATRDTNSTSLTAQQGVDAVNREKAQIEKEIAQMSDPVNQIQRIQNSTLDDATKNALIASLFKGSSGSKPTLTAAQAKEAYDSGTRTQSVVDAYNYYYGTDYNNSDDNTEQKQDLKSLVYDYNSYYSSLNDAQKKLLESTIREEAQRVLKEAGKKYGSWEVDSLLREYGFSKEDAKRISGQ